MSRMTSLSQAVALMTLCISLARVTVEAGCIKAAKCCQGKDNTCVTEGPRENKKNNETCFCDSACLELGDCCTDYKSYCKMTDCVLAKTWDEWGECDTRCGFGSKQRIRRVIQEALNGGKPCGPTIQRAMCEGINCKVARAPGLVEEMRETGQILPLSLGQWRDDKLYSPFKDIRRNIFEQNLGGKTNEIRPSYCAHYELTEVRSACNRHHDNSGSHDNVYQDWTRQLVKGSIVCVECQPMAMQAKLGGRCYGHGAYLRQTRWTALTAPGCHGLWNMTSQREDCQCSAGESNTLSIILV